MEAPKPVRRGVVRSLVGDLSKSPESDEADLLMERKVRTHTKQDILCHRLRYCNQGLHSGWTGPAGGALGASVR